MERLIEIFFDQIIKEICGEGERRLKLQALSACLEVVRGIRKLILLGFLYCFACFLSALSFFATGYLLVEQWHSTQPNFLDPRFLFSGIVFVASIGLLAITVREKRWEAAFGLKERIEGLESAAAQPAAFTETELALLVGKIVEQKLREHASEPASTEAKGA